MQPGAIDHDTALRERPDQQTQSIDGAAQSR
ncbi:hypothetical protein ACVWZD_006497 [Streptomyces sp. TE3672]